MKRNRSIACRLLAAAAWLVALIWFALTTIASWGFSPIGLLLWSLPAWFILEATFNWWARLGVPVAPQTGRWLRKTWRRLVLAAASFYVAIAVAGWLVGDREPLGTVFEIAFWTGWAVLGALCLVFPVAVSGWAIWRSLRVQPT